MTRESWFKVHLADLCESISYGYTQASTSTPNGPKFLRITDIVKGLADWASIPYCEIPPNIVERYRLRHGDIVIARTGASTGSSLYIKNPPDAVFASYLIRLRIKKTVNSRFVSYFLASPQYKNYIRGVLGDKSAQPNANAKTLTQVELKLPPLEEQNNIARMLGSLDDKIELNRQMDFLLEKIAQALFKHWFIDFEFPDEGGRPYKSSGGMIEDSGPRKKPRGWELVRLGDLVSLERGLSYKGKFLSQTGIPMINLGTIAPNYGFIKNGLKWYVGDFLAKQLVAPGDIVLANTDITQRREVLGSPAVVPADLGSDRILFSHHVYAIRNTSDLPNLYIYYLLQQRSYRDRVRGFATGTTVLALPPETILNYTFIKPDNEVLNKFDLIASQLHKQMACSDIEAAILARIRDLLIPRFMAGLLKLGPDAASEACNKIGKTISNSQQSLRNWP